MTLRLGLLFTAALFLAPPAAAQDADSVPPIVRAVHLPVLVTDARRAGVADAQVRGLLDTLRRRRIPAADAEPVVREEVEAVHAGAPKDNFGAFVHQQLEAGLRGRALADAIHAEHQARGMGRGRSEDHRSPARDTVRRSRGRKP